MDPMQNNPSRMSPIHTMTPDELAGHVLRRQLHLPSHFAEPVYVQAAKAQLGPAGSLIRLRVRTIDGQLAPVTLAPDELLQALGEEEESRSTGVAATGLAVPDDLFLLVEAARIRLAYAFDPYFAVSLSGIEPLPHQLEAVYERMLPQPRLRFALCDDPGAGKTIMAGLLIKELKLRGALDRVLVLAPAPLTIQWQDELRAKFDEVFEVIGSDLARNQLAGNAWERFPQCITSVDFAKQESVAPGLLRVRWDLVIVDEAHKASARTSGDKVDKTHRYNLVEQLSANTERLLLLTATPHSGNADQFAHFMRLIDADQFADPRGAPQPVNPRFLQGDSPYFLRRMKEDLRDFEGRKLFRKRHAYTQQFTLGAAELALYDAVTRYINEFLPRSASGRRRSSVALARTVFQRRLASSLRAIHRSLVNRQRRLRELLVELDRMSDAEQERRLRALADPAFDVEQDTDDADEMTEDVILNAALVARRVADIRREVAALEELIRLAKATEASGEEAKLTALRECLRRAQFGELTDGRGKLLIFTEHRDTLDYLYEMLSVAGYTCCVIHGGMDAQQRKAAQDDFLRTAQICIATEAAGEGINLQFCHLMINYDVPWSPVRLEQRMGRIHRIGQESDVHIFNFVAGNTVEGEIIQRLLRKLDQMRVALGDRVFDVVGQLLQLNNVDLEEMLREVAYNPQRAREYEEQIDRMAPERLTELERATGIALAASQVDLSPIRERDWRSEERRLMPEYVERFFRAAAAQTGLRVEERADGLLRIEHVNERFRSPSLEALRRYGVPRDAYRKLTFRKADLQRAAQRDAELLSPGHPLFAAVTEVLQHRLAPATRASAAFIDPSAPAPYRLHFFEVGVLGERAGATSGQTMQTTLLHAALVAIAEDAAGKLEIAAADALHDLTPAGAENIAPGMLPEAPTPVELEDLEDWVATQVQYGLEQDQRRARERELTLRADYLQEAFRASIQVARAKFMQLSARVLGGDTDARLARDEARRRVDELEARERQKLGELAHLRVVRPGPIKYVASALVVPAPAAPDLTTRLREEDALGDPGWMRRDDEVERIAMEYAMAHERAAGWEPQDVSKLRDGSGFDIRSLGPRDDLGRRPVRRIEVKGRAVHQGDVLLTPNEWLQARRHGPTYQLYVVWGCGSGRERLHIVEDPATRLAAVARKLTVVKGYHIPADAIVAHGRASDSPD